MPRPNILWYCTDQQRFDTIGALGNPHVHTPALDRLCSEGTAFTHTYCQSPICTPSRASFMTGLYPSRLHNCRNGNESFPADAPPLISKLLADAGYDCGMIGKFHLQSSGRRTEPRLDDGYRYWRFSHAPRDDWPQGHDYAEWVRAQGADLDAQRNRPERVDPELHQTKWASDCAIEFISQQFRRSGIPMPDNGVRRLPDLRGSQQRTQPWMLTINVYDPHPPFIPPKRYADRFDPAALPGPYFRESDLTLQEKLKTVDFQTFARRPGVGSDELNGRTIQALYYAMIAQIDDQFARILAHLEQTGQRENTVIIFTSDHGEMLGDHGLLYKGCRFYEGLVRVPLIFAWPGRFRENLKCPALVELLDMSATMLDVAGVPIPEYFQGKSLLPILRGEAPPDHHRDYVRCEYYDALDSAFVGTGSPDKPKPGGQPAAGKSSRAAASPPCAVPAGTFGTMYRDARYKIAVYHGHDRGELYDLENDPWEFENLWDSPEHQPLKCELLLKNFDAAMLTGVDVGTRRIAPM